MKKDRYNDKQRSQLAHIDSMKNAVLLAVEDLQKKLYQLTIEAMNMPHSSAYNDAIDAGEWTPEDALNAQIVSVEDCEWTLADLQEIISRTRRAIKSDKAAVKKLNKKS